MACSYYRDEQICRISCPELASSINITYSYSFGEIGKLQFVKHIPAQVMKTFAVNVIQTKL